MNRNAMTSHVTPSKAPFTITANHWLLVIVLYTTNTILMILGMYRICSAWFYSFYVEGRDDLRHGRLTFLFGGPPVFGVK